MICKLLKTTLVGLGLAVLAGLQGCQSYRPSPVDLDEYSRQWAERSLTDETLVEFASGLVVSEHHQQPFNVENGVSLSEAKLIGLLFNPQLSKRRLESRIPLARKSRRALLPDPQIELDFNPVEDGLDSDWLLNGQLGFVVPLSFRIGTELDKIESEYRAELLALLKAEQQTMERIHELWIALYTVDRKTEILQNHLTGLEEVIDQAGQSLTLTSMSAADLQSLALEAATVRSDVLEIKEQRAERFAELVSLMGIKLDTPLTFQFDLTPVVVPDKSQWQSLLLVNDTELKLARAHYQVAEHALELEISKQYPDLVIGPIHQEGVSNLGLNLTSLLPIWNRNLPAIERARLERDAARKALESTYQQRINTVISLHQRAELLLERERFFNQRLAPMIDQQFENIWQSIQLGAANVLLLQDTLRQRLEAKLQMLDTVEKRTILQHEIEFMLEPAYRRPVDLSGVNTELDSTESDSTKLESMGE